MHSHSVKNSATNNIVLFDKHISLLSDFKLKLLEEELKSLLDKSFSHLLKSLDKNNNSRFTIPLNEDGKPRISEHEMKLSFIETFLKCSEFEGYMYSVETPTQNVYRFTEKGKRQKPKCICEQNEKGRRGNIDVVVFVGEERVALIEFKANHAGSFEHAKDVCKLEKEPLSRQSQIENKPRARLH